MTVEGNYSLVGKDKNIILINLFEDDLAVNAVTISNLIYQLIEDNKLNIILDCKKVKRITSSGLGVLVGALKRLKERGGHIVLLHLYPHIMDIFVETHLTALFPVFDAGEVAIRAIEDGILDSVEFSH